MSIPSEVERITALRNNIRTALENLSISASSSNITECAEKVDAITEQAATTLSPGNSIAAGTYLTGDVTIAGNSNLVAGNIKKGVTIFGVTGTFS